MTRRASRTTLLAVAVSVLVSILQALPIMPARASLPRTGSNVHRWEPEFMAANHTYTRSAALRHARRFDVIVAVRGSFDRHVAAMKRENPSLTLLVYLNGAYSMNDNGRKYANSLYAHDRNGDKIKSREFGSYLMDVSSSDWTSHVRNLCSRLRSDSGYDGCFLDSMGPAALDSGYVTGLPVDPSTDAVWTRSDYLNATHDLASVVKADLGSRPLVINGVQQGSAYFDPDGSTGILADGIEGGMVELFVRPPYASIRYHRRPSRWREDVDMLVDAGASGRSLLCVTKVWISATKRAKERRHKFALATFLMGTNGSSYFSFLGSRDTGKKDRAWIKDLGAPVEPYSASSGLFSRTFSKGIVFANPTSDTVAVRLAERMVTLGGNLISSVKVRRYRGVLLLYS
jgi:hypothetical protein